MLPLLIKNLYKNPNQVKKLKAKQAQSQALSLCSPLSHQGTNYSPPLVSSLYILYIPQRKGLIRRIKKQVLNPTLTLTLVLRAKHNVHCLYEGFR